MSAIPDQLREWASCLEGNEVNVPGIIAGMRDVANDVERDETQAPGLAAVTQDAEQFILHVRNAIVDGSVDDKSGKLLRSCALMIERLQLARKENTPSEGWPMPEALTKGFSHDRPDLRETLALLDSLKNHTLVRVPALHPMDFAAGVTKGADGEMHERLPLCVTEIRKAEVLRVAFGDKLSDLPEHVDHEVANVIMRILGEFTRDGTNDPVVEIRVVSS